MDLNFLFEMSPFKEQNENFLRVLDVVNPQAMTPKERAEYEENLKIYRDWRNALEYAVEQGMKKGLEEAELLRNLQIAANCKREGIDPHIISECTGISLEEIEEL